MSMLQQQVEQLLRKIYGRKPEHLDPNQLMVDLLTLEAINIRKRREGRVMIHLKSPD